MSFTPKNVVSPFGSLFKTPKKPSKANKKLQSPQKRRARSPCQFPPPHKKNESHAPRPALWRWGLGGRPGHRSTLSCRQQHLRRIDIRRGRGWVWGGSFPRMRAVGQNWNPFLKWIRSRFLTTPPFALERGPPSLGLGALSSGMFQTSGFVQKGCEASGMRQGSLPVPFKHLSTKRRQPTFLGH